MKQIKYKAESSTCSFSLYSSIKTLIRKYKHPRSDNHFPPPCATDYETPRIMSFASVSISFFEWHEKQLINSTILFPHFSFFSTFMKFNCVIMERSRWFLIRLNIFVTSARSARYPASGIAASVNATDRRKATRNRGEAKQVAIYISP